MGITQETKRFEVGKEYSCRSVCDHDCVWTFKVVSRTEKTVTLEDALTRKTCKRRPNVWDGQEVCFPLGYYSMCPIIRA